MRRNGKGSPSVLSAIEAIIRLFRYSDNYIDLSLYSSGILRFRKGFCYFIILDIFFTVLWIISGAKNEAGAKNEERGFGNI